MTTPRRVYFGIPVNDYRHFQPLQFCINDAWAVATQLRLLGLYDETHVATDATASAILQRLRQVAAGLNAGDTLVIHLALHGVLDANDDHIFLLAAADSRFEAEHCLSLSSLRNQVGGVDGLDVVFLIDACRGPLGEHAGAQLASTRQVRVVLDRERQAERDAGGRKTAVRRARFTEVFACSDHDVAQEVAELQQGVFTRALLDVLLQREADAEPFRIDQGFEEDLVARMTELSVGQAGEVRVAPFLRKPAGHVAVVVKDWRRRGKGRVAVPVPVPVPPEPKPAELPTAPKIAVLAAPKVLVQSSAGELVLPPRYQNGVGMVMIRVEPGTFDMGSPASEVGRDTDEKLHTVTISRAYAPAETQVTQRQWTEVMGTRPWQGKACVIERDDVGAATHVSWSDAEEFCRKLTAREHAAGRLPAGHSYRLPTEAEWERATRAGTKTRWSFGDNESDLAGHAVYESSRLGKHAHRVKTKRPNPWGFHDCHGNVWEACLDVVEWDGKVVSDADVDGAVDPLGTSGSHRVARGGSWISSARGLRSADRVAYGSGLQNSIVGFRPVLAARSDAKPDEPTSDGRER